MREGRRGAWHGSAWPVRCILASPPASAATQPARTVKGGGKVYHCGGGIVYHPHDEKELDREPGGVRSGAGVRRSGLSQESSGSSETWEAALCRLWRRR